MKDLEDIALEKVMAKRPYSNGYDQIIHSSLIEENPLISHFIFNMARDGDNTIKNYDLSKKSIWLGEKSGQQIHHALTLFYDLIDTNLDHPIPRVYLKNTYDEKDLSIKECQLYINDLRIINPHSVVTMYALMNNALKKDKRIRRIIKKRKYT